MRNLFIANLLNTLEISKILNTMTICEYYLVLIYGENKMKINVCLTFGVLFILATSMTPISANVVITENFDSGLSSWGLKSYNLIDGVFTAKSSEITNESGAIQFPETCCDFTDVHFAYIDSTVSYGTWSVDWKVSDAGTSYSTIPIMMKDNITNYEIDGYTEDQLRMEGYALVISSYNANAFFPTPGATLLKYIGNDANTFWVELEQFKFNEDLEGWHHIDIVRSDSGNFSILLDFKNLFSVIDNEWKVNERFGLMNFNGGSAFDNLRISNTMDLNPDDYPPYYPDPTITPDPTTTPDSTTTSSDPESTDDDSPISLEFFFVSFLATVIIRRKLKNI